jgi:hypothetical protein
MRTDKLDLLDIIDHLHGVIDAALKEIEKRDSIIIKLEDELKMSDYDNSDT